MAAIIESIHIGQPKALRDERGEWVSSIKRECVNVPTQVLTAGLLGDKVTQLYHGGPDAAICVHLCDHYRFWKKRYGLELKPGNLGENFVLDGITEDEIFAGDIIRAGTALLQVSGPRVPCANQARHVGRFDWVKLTIHENRTGFYVRVLEPGIVCQGGNWDLHQRLNEIGSITLINSCFYSKFDANFARHALTLNGLGDWWKQQFREKLKGEQEHWSTAMSN